MTFDEFLKVSEGKFRKIEKSEADFYFYLKKKKNQIALHQRKKNYKNNFA